MHYVLQMDRSELRRAIVLVSKQRGRMIAGVSREHFPFPSSNFIESPIYQVFPDYSRIRVYVMCP